MLIKILKILFLFLAVVFLAGISAYITLNVIIKGEKPVGVPDLAGKDVIEVLEILADLQLNIKIAGMAYSGSIPKNHVIFQEPAAGEAIKQGRSIRITLSRGPEHIVMPDLRRMSVQRAQMALEQKGLGDHVISAAFSGKVEKDNIIAQAPSPGSRVRQGTPAGLLVSAGLRPRAFKMPDMTGLFSQEAMSMIQEYRLLAGEITGVSEKGKRKNTVIRQEPPRGYRVLEGDRVDLTINRKSGTGAGFAGTEQETRLFRYRAEPGFLNRRIRMELRMSGLSGNYFDGFLKPGEEIWFLAPAHDTVSVSLYELDKVVKIWTWEP